MKKLSLALLVSTLACTPVQAENSQTYFTDSDWNISMSQWNDYIGNQDIKWVSNNGNKSLQFTLKGGVPGYSPGDDQPQLTGHKFRQRNELHYKGINNTVKQTINFKVKIVEGLKGRRGSFFQIHSHVYKTCNKASPPLALQIHKGRLVAVTRNSWSAITTYKDIQRTYLSDVKRKEMLGKWQDFTVIKEPIDSNHFKFTIRSVGLGISQTLPKSYMLCLLYTSDAADE